MTSNNPIQKSLTSLLPGSTVPARLISATESLVSVSRQRAANLKTDEEIARSHVCAEIACKKLRVTLRLPNIKSGAGAPCRPTVYKKLLTFLDSTLADVDIVGTPGGRKKTTGEVKTPTRTPTTAKRKRDAEAEALDAEEAQVDTPSKKRRTGGATPATTRTPTKSAQKKTNGFVGRIEKSVSTKSTAQEAPEYVLPSIRKLCKTFSTPSMVPHVYTGVCVILSLASRWPRPSEASDADSEADEGAEALESMFKEDVMACVVALYLLTLTRMQEGLMTTEVYNTVLGRSVEVLDLQDKTGEVGEGIEGWIARIQENGWTTDEGKGTDWWSSVPEDVLKQLRLDSVTAGENGVVEAGTETEDTEDEEDGSPTPKARRKRTSQTNGVGSRREELRKQLEDEDPEDVLLPGLGTMMNDAVDFLSEERQAEYERWKAGILRRIATIEKGGGSPRKRRIVATAA
ncbi:hypothetical protein H2198_007958 [Neophaeococcomyces mojaviensis]|uniref:Uncharacterized protein n=1 Tax=Neophaeococcomyces mojaviensis TaxID=3383035 RepID=A0ACC2ZYQ0_9EURO|nr:hypothetical protein H2198_007958 [Knufia sp. JES_112]